MGDVLTLHEDGTVTIGWGDVSTTLREPTVGEWLSFMQESERANQWAKGDTPEEGEPTPRTVQEAADDGPFLKLYQRMLSVLGGLDVGTDAMPPWLAVGATFDRISAWWSANPLSRQALAAATRTLTP